jgi:hypothetical protein
MLREREAAVHQAELQKRLERDAELLRAVERQSEQEKYVCEEQRLRLAAEREAAVSEQEAERKSALEARSAATAAAQQVLSSELECERQRSFAVNLAFAQQQQQIADAESLRAQTYAWEKSEIEARHEAAIQSAQRAVEQQAEARHSQLLQQGAHDAGEKMAVLQQGQAK